MVASHSCWQPALDPSPTLTLNFLNVPPRLCSLFICNIPPVSSSVSAYSLCYGCRATTLWSIIRQFSNTIPDSAVGEAISHEHIGHISPASDLKFLACRCTGVCCGRAVQGESVTTLCPPGIGENSARYDC